MKNKIILTAKHGRPSTKEVYSSMSSGVLVQRRQIFSKLNRALLRTYYRVFSGNNTTVMAKEQSVSFLGSIVIRWGTREEIETNSSTIVYNQSKAIAIATDKKLSRETFIANNVSTPALVTPDTFREEYLPIIARPFTHSKGTNFVTLQNRASFLEHYRRNSGGWYYSQFINKEREFRIHCAHSKVLAVMEKSNPANGNIAWNRAQNDTDPFTYIPWSEVDTQNLKPVLEEAIKATVAVGLDMSGVDVMLRGGTAYVLEVNTAPTLNTSPYVASRWGMYFDWLFRSETRRDHWDITKFKKGSSLIWKNYQLTETKEGTNEEN